ncbi:hypothetical protein As57867_004913, partial [Aphanomyces stellatus]
MVISCYDLKTCVAIGGTTCMLGGKAFQVPQYSRYGPNYYVTFTKVNNPDMARAIVAELASLTKAVIAAFNLRPIKRWPRLTFALFSRRPRRRLNWFRREEILCGKSLLRIQRATHVVFQHKIAALNTKLPPSILARRGEKRSTSKNGSNPPVPAQSTPQRPSPDVNTDFTDTETRSVCAQSTPP